MQKNRFDNQKQLIDDTGDLTSHLLDRLAFTSEKTIASLVLLLSTIPEYVGMASATGNRSVSVVAACVSLVVVKLALRERPHRVQVPLVGQMRIPVFWLLYAAQIAAGIAFIADSGNYIDIGLIVISAVGAICSERIAQVIKMEARDSAKINVDAERNTIRLEELRRNAELRIATKQAEFDAKYGSVETISQSSDISPNVGYNPISAISAEQARAGQKSSQEARQTAAQQRQNELYRLLLDKFDGQDIDSLNKSALGRELDVSATTIKRDIEQLRGAGMLNGRVSQP